MIDDALIAQVFTEISEQLRLRYAQLDGSVKADPAYCFFKARDAAKEGDFIGAILYGALGK